MKFVPSRPAVSDFVNVYILPGDMIDKASHINIIDVKIIYGQNVMYSVLREP